MQIKEQSIESLKPYSNNARTHSDEQITQIAESISTFGFNNPILVDSDNNIIAGHGRLLGAKRLGLSMVPTIVLQHLTAPGKKAYILADNKIALNAGWSFDLLKTEFEDILATSDIDLGLTGFDKDEINTILNPEILNVGETDPDAVPEIKADAITRLGDVWLLGEHRLMCGDGTTLDCDKLIGAQIIDMVYTDPPYGINLDTNYKKRYGHSKGSQTSQFYGEDKGINLYEVINHPACINAKDLFIWGADNYPDCLPRGGSWIVWDKSVEAVDGIASDFELCWSRERHHYSMMRKLWKGAKAREETGQEGAHRTRWGHPTQKPIELATYFFDKWGKKAISILDLFGGSGTTLIACEKTNRKCLMMEISPHYCDVIIKRWQKFANNTAFLESTQQSFDEVANG